MRFKILCCFIALTAFSVLGLKNWSRYFFTVTSLVIIFEVTVLLAEESNKLILFLLFFYVVIAYYFYQLWEGELDESFYNPRYEETAIFKPMLQKINVFIESDKSEYQGILTNWNDNGAFICLDKPINVDEMKKIVNIKIGYNNKEFIQRARCMSYTKDKLGVGFKFFYTEDEGKFNWFELNKIFNDLGYWPNYLG